MNVLAIETSCDDTCVAVLEIRKQPFGESASRPAKLEIRSNIVSSQVKIHRKWGGVYPTLAKREHQKNLPVVFTRALNKAGNPKIDFIAVTMGPGLEPCLWTGINFAKEQSKKLDLPILPINHIEAHIFANLLTKFPPKNQHHNIIFPAVCLIVSGGHTQLILMKNFGKYKILGETRDDAAGECFDKTARILGLGYPGGPIVAKMATKFKIQKQPYGESASRPTKFKIKLPRPMIYQKNYDFSFSGLKTAVLYLHKKLYPKIKNLPTGRQEYIQEMCREIQQAIIDVLISKTLKAAKDFKVKSIILGGGVVANEELRKQFKKKVKKELPNIQYLVPNIKFCTDNAAMVAVAGYFNWQKKKDWKEIKANANLKIGEKL